MIELQLTHTHIHTHTHTVSKDSKQDTRPRIQSAEKSLGKITIYWTFPPGQQKWTVEDLCAIPNDLLEIYCQFSEPVTWLRCC